MVLWRSQVNLQLVSNYYLIFEDNARYNKYGIKSKFLSYSNIIARRIFFGEMLVRNKRRDNKDGLIKLLQPLKKPVAVEENAGLIYKTCHKE